jgi:hypothetical protein
MSQTSFIRSCFIELVSFTEDVHDLASIQCSPYAPNSAFAQELALFPYKRHFFLFLSGTHKSPTRWKDFHEIQARYRLACLLHIHCTFIYNRSNPDEFREEWRRIFQNLIRHGIDKAGNVENLRSFMLIPPSPDGKTRFDPERELKVLRMVSAAKEMSLDSLDRLGNMFFGYILGQKYDGWERIGVWDIDRMEDELFGGGNQDHVDTSFGSSV